MTMFAAIWTAISLLGLAALPAGAAGCERIDFEGLPFTVCEADPATDNVRLFLNDESGRPLGTFGKVAETLEDEGRRLVFATNGGMYHPDRRPVGLYIEDGRTLSRIVTTEGPGNFGLLPNGVLCVTERSVRVIETRAYVDEGPDCRFATQSGPMLVIDGALHPRFLPGSDSRFIRNGVGVTSEGRLFIAISEQPVTFHRFARLFRDVLQVPNALFLDGKVSRLYAPELGRQGFGLPLGPILGVTLPAD